MTTFKLVGEPLLSEDPTGRLRSRVATVFLHTKGLVTLPGIHATQRFAWIQALNDDRATCGEPPLTEAEIEVELDTSVDLLLDGNTVLIRPLPARMDLAFLADELLQTLVSKYNIHFLNTANESVRNALRYRGENWRMCPLPRSQEEIILLIADSRTAIQNAPVYYYNRAAGTRFLTCEAFRWFATMDEGPFRAQVEEVARFCVERNRLGYPEIDLFPPDSPFDRAALAVLNDPDCPDADLRIRHAALAAAYEAAVPPALRADKPEAAEWRKAMCGALLKQMHETVAADIVRGLSAEFYLQIEWLAGARIEDGELIFDSIFDEGHQSPEAPELRRVCDLRARGMIFNYVREFHEIEYVNIGRVSRSLSPRVASANRPTVYIAEVKHAHATEPVIRILRLQKWGIAEHLDEGKDLLQSILEAEEYTDYILDRRLGCQQLGMNLPSQTTARRISETYTGTNTRYHGKTYWLSYIERPYLCGWATDKIPPYAYQNLEFNRRLAALLGTAAATNLIVGRTRGDGVTTLFDSGDEVVLLGEDGLPRSLAVADHTGTFSNYLQSLQDLASAYAAPINRRVRLIPNAHAFAAAYLDAFVQEFVRIQGEYLLRKRAFDSLFRHRTRDEAGSFAYRWECVLKRLAEADPQALVPVIRAAMQLDERKD